MVTISPFHPIEQPDGLFREIDEVADAVVIDHFIEGDGTPNGSRTLRTLLPEAMYKVDAASIDLDHRDHIVAIARQIMPGRVGVSAGDFAGNFS